MLFATSERYITFLQDLNVSFLPLSTLTRNHPRICHLKNAIVIEKIISNVNLTKGLRMKYIFSKFASSLVLQCPGSTK